MFHSEHIILIRANQSLPLLNNNNNNNKSTSRLAEKQLIPIL